MDRPAPARQRRRRAGDGRGAPRERYFNRELCWLAFNRRVLEEACNPAHPLLERLRFLSISGNNLDEFFMVRVAGLKGQQLQDVEERSADGLTPAQQLAAIAARGGRADRQPAGGLVDLRGAAARGRHVACSAATRSAPRTAPGSTRHFREQIFPVITPQAIDPAHPVPVHPEQGLLADLRPEAASPTASRSANC